MQIICRSARTVPSKGLPSRRASYRKVALPTASWTMHADRSCHKRIHQLCVAIHLFEHLPHLPHFATFHHILHWYPMSLHHVQVVKDVSVSKPSPNHSAVFAVVRTLRPVERLPVPTCRLSEGCPSRPPAGQSMQTRLLHQNARTVRSHSLDGRPRLLTYRSVSG